MAIKSRDVKWCLVVHAAILLIDPCVEQSDHGHQVARLASGVDHPVAVAVPESHQGPKNHLTVLIYKTTRPTVRCLRSDVYGQVRLNQILADKLWGSSLVGRASFIGPRSVQLS